jgi:hypothetical protein
MSIVILLISLLFTLATIVFTLVIMIVAVGVPMYFMYTQF